MIRRSLDEILERAHVELRINPTVTEYIIANDGVEMRFSPLQYGLIELEDLLRGTRAKYEELGVSFALLDRTLKRQWEHR